MPPVTKLLQARYARMTRIEPLQMISNVLFIQSLYNEITKAEMGIIPNWDPRVGRTLKYLIRGITVQLVNRIRLPKGNFRLTESCQTGVRRS